jgi:hypothetical protein
MLVHTGLPRVVKKCVIIQTGKIARSTVSVAGIGEIWELIRINHTVAGCMCCVVIMMEIMVMVVGFLHSTRTFGALRDSTIVKNVLTGK